MKNLMRRAVALVIERGSLTVEEAVGLLGRHVTAAEAAAKATSRERQRRALEGKPPRALPPDVLAERGRRLLLAKALWTACRRGLVSRRAPGVYGPPPPRLYDGGRCGIAS